MLALSHVDYRNSARGRIFRRTIFLIGFVNNGMPGTPNV